MGRGGCQRKRRRSHLQQQQLAILNQPISIDGYAATDLHPLHPPETPEQLPSCQTSHIHTCQKMARRYRAYTDQCRRNRDAESWCPKRNLHAKNIKPLIILSQDDRSPSPRVPLSSRRGLSTTNFLTIMLAVNFREMDVEMKRRIFNFGASQRSFGADARSFSDCNLRISENAHYRCTTLTI